MPERRPYIQNPERGCYAQITPLETIESDGEWSTSFRVSCQRNECPIRDRRFISGFGQSSQAAEDQLKEKTSAMIETNCLVRTYREDYSGFDLLDRAIDLKHRRDAEATQGSA